MGNYAKILVEGVSGRAFLSLDEADDLVYNNMENARRHAAVRLEKNRKIQKYFTQQREKRSSCCQSLRAAHALAFGRVGKAG